MKHTLSLIIILFCLSIFSCKKNKNLPDPNSLEDRTELLIHQIPSGELKILEIEGCEYIVYQDARHSNLGFGYMTHKGNCKNPIHIYNERVSIDSLINN